MSEQGRGRRPPRGLHTCEKLAGVLTCVSAVVATLKDTLPQLANGPDEGLVETPGKGQPNIQPAKLKKAKLGGVHLVSANFSGWTQLEALLRHAPRGAHILFAQETGTPPDLVDDHSQKALRLGSKTVWATSPRTVSQGISAGAAMFARLWVNFDIRLEGPAVLVDHRLVRTAFSIGRLGTVVGYSG